MKNIDSLKFPIVVEATGNPCIDNHICDRCIWLSHYNYWITHPLHDYVGECFLYDIPVIMFDGRACPEFILRPFSDNIYPKLIKGRN